jgi:limonene-1,2-epoxide hydrolase
METSTRTDLDVVRDFLVALERLDLDAAFALLDDVVVYQNVPFPAARGRRSVERQLRALERCSGFEAAIHHIADDGTGTVLTERTDAIVLGRLRAAFWVCGTFEVRDGRIVLWRDHFDLANVLWGFLKGAVLAVVRRQ